MENYLPIIIAAVVVSIVSYYNEVRGKKLREEHEKEKFKESLKVDLGIEPKDIEEVKKIELDDKK